MESIWLIKLNGPDGKTVVGFFVLKPVAHLCSPKHRTGPGPFFEKLTWHTK